MLGCGATTSGRRDPPGPSGPNSSLNTRSNASTCAGPDTMVASAQACSSASVVARITVSAPASRSLRSGPAGSPADRSATASTAASAA